MARLHRYLHVRVQWGVHVYQARPLVEGIRLWRAWLNLISDRHLVLRVLSNHIVACDSDSLLNLGSLLELLLTLLILLNLSLLFLIRWERDKGAFARAKAV